MKQMGTFKYQNRACEPQRELVMYKLEITEPVSKTIQLYALYNEKYPREIRLVLRALYEKAILMKPGGPQELKAIPSFYVLASRGSITLSNNTDIKIEAELDVGRYSGGKPIELKIKTRPLSRQDIHHIDAALGSGPIKVHWHVDAYGLIAEYREDDRLVLESGFCSISILPDEGFEISREYFVKQVLEPVDMLRRVFLEVVLEPVETLDINDADIRWGLQLLFQQQQILKEALNRLATARTASDYMDIISHVRRAIEPLRANDRLRSLLARAIKELNLVRSDVEPDAINEASDEIASTIISNLQERRGNFANYRLIGPDIALFNFSSRMGAHTTTLRRNLPFTPRPQRREAEYALYMAIIYVNYLIRLLNALGLRT